jgi:signal peptidase I
MEQIQPGPRWLPGLRAKLSRADGESWRPRAPARHQPPIGPSPNRRIRSLIRFAVLLVVAAAFAFGLRTLVVQPFYVPSGSMETTLHGCGGCNDDRLLVDKLSYRLHAVHRGDVVVFRRPPRAPTADADLVKRVVGLPGETVGSHGGRLYIGGRVLGNRVLDEPYVNPACPPMPDFGPVAIPAGKVFVMGDNRCNSLDSRVFDPVPESLILGRAFIIVWPFARIHWL